jgi:hypothetical protein
MGTVLLDSGICYLEVHSITLLETPAISTFLW